ncbi:glycosyltransferase family 4 protein [Roseiflexus castenholzii]|jgi:glycosyltransferase involved in cell wall biosynthesis|uniref:Glycosyl transferase group 1 n=1 Tax=Roseiflexus castenholzii (strain DSM 13941 / HLO8) TaxID=383372 RepID=A7NM08_ROSCS|nr:glycosyltransferase family 4 protein [Roseiflexus castenholzii]ABU58563.1 glycosyl transferase group 1 [Roseiflexus castenholzii DSM 13941]
MRILMLSWEYPPHMVGGLGRHVTDLTDALAQISVEVHIVTPNLHHGASEERTAQGVYVHRVAIPPVADRTFFPLTQELNSALRHAALDLHCRIGGFDLIHAHDWLVAPAGMTLKRFCHAPLLATIHATERGRQQGHLTTDLSIQIDRLERLLASEAIRVIACSHFMAHEICTAFDTPREKIEVVPNGVVIRPAPFDSDEERLAFRRRFVRDDQQLVFSVGRIVYEKGLHLLVDAWSQVLMQFPQARLVIAGVGAYLDALRERAQRAGLADSILFTGRISDDERDRLYHAADAAVFPSLYEPFGIVALEAMAAKCPVIVAHTGGLAEVVKLHETGLTVYPNNVDSLAWGIRHTLAHPDWSQQRATNAFREVGARYNWQTIAQMTVEIYRRVCEEWRYVQRDALPAATLQYTSAYI